MALVGMTPAFRGFQLSRTNENREAYRRALRDAKLEEKPWLIPLKGSNENENRQSSSYRAAQSYRSLKWYLQRIHETHQDSFALLVPNLRQEDGLQAPEKAHLHSKDRVGSWSERSSPLYEKTADRPRSFTDRFLSLPVELRLMILENLHFGDIDRLRRSCRSFRTAIDKSMIRAVFPNFSEVLSTTCRYCLGTDQTARLIIKDDDHPLQPLGNLCWRCASKKKEYQVGKQYHMVEEIKGYFCRWCGFPTIREGRSRRTRTQYHSDCYRMRIRAMFCYMVAGLLQWAALFAASGMCWAHFDKYASITGSTIVSLKGWV
jgi:hypothetical protein